MTGVPVDALYCVLCIVPSGKVPQILSFLRFDNANINFITIGNNRFYNFEEL